MTYRHWPLRLDRRLVLGVQERRDELLGLDFL